MNNEDKPIQILAGLLESLDNKSSMEEFVKSFEVVVQYVKETRDLTEQEIEKLENIVASGLSNIENSTKSDFKSLKSELTDKVTKFLTDKLDKLDKKIESRLELKLNEVDARLDNIRDGKDADEEMIVGKVLSQVPKIDLKPLEDKIEEVEKKIPTIDNKRLDDIERIAKANQMPVTTSFVNGKRAKNLNFTGATVSHSGDTAEITITGGTGAVDSVNGQTGVVVLDADDIDDTSTTNKFVTATDITKLSNLSGTNTGDVTLTGEDYLSITGQQITANAIDLDNLSATGTPSSATFLRGDNTWATPAGSGDVSKVGTPVDNQVGVWTGDGTIEGTSGLTYNGSTLAVTGDVTVSDEAYGAGWNGSLEVPTKNAVYDKIETISSGGITRSIVTTSGSATMGATASTDYVYLVAGAHTMTLPDVTSNNNRYTVKNNHSANITINTTSSQLIEGATSITISPESSVDIIGSGTAWFVV